MTAETMTAQERLSKYQSRHVIAVQGIEPRCAVDSIRIHPVKGGRWRHDNAEIAALMETVYSEAWPSRERAIERVVDTVALCECECPDCQEDEHPVHDGDGFREGQPEFNGAFR